MTIPCVDMIFSNLNSNINLLFSTAGYKLVFLTPFSQHVSFTLYYLALKLSPADLWWRG